MNVYLLGPHHHLVYRQDWHSWGSPSSLGILTGISSASMSHEYMIGSTGELHDYLGLQGKVSRELPVACSKLIETVIDI